MAGVRGKAPSEEDRQRLVETLKRFFITSFGPEEEGYSYGQLLPFRMKQGTNEVEWGLGYFPPFRMAADALRTTDKAVSGEEVTPAEALGAALTVATLAAGLGGKSAQHGTVGMFVRHSGKKNAPEVKFYDTKAGDKTKQVFTQDPMGNVYEEISDALARLKVKLLPKKEWKGQLGDLVEHPELYNRLPDLEKIPVEVLLSHVYPRQGSYLYPSSPLGEGITAVGTERTLLPTILHEVQHAVQTRQNLPRGSSPSAFTNRIRQVTQGQYDEATTQKAAVEAYKKTLGEYFAREVSQRYLNPKRAGRPVDLTEPEGFFLAPNKVGYFNSPEGAQELIRWLAYQQAQKRFPIVPLVMPPTP